MKNDEYTKYDFVNDIIAKAYEMRDLEPDNDDIFMDTIDEECEKLIDSHGEAFADKVLISINTRIMTAAGVI